MEECGEATRDKGLGSNRVNGGTGTVLLEAMLSLEKKMYTGDLEPQISAVALS